MGRQARKVNQVRAWLLPECGSKTSVCLSAANLGYQPEPTHQPTTRPPASINLLAWVRETTIVISNSGHKAASPCLF